MGEDLDHNNRVREVQPDIEIVGSIAPAANIVVYFAGSECPSENFVSR
jgi:subtilase family serine protease